VIEINGHAIDVGWIRFAGQLVVTLIIASGVYFKLDNRVTNDTSQIAMLRSQEHEMDATGTRKSHEIDQHQQQQIDYMETRLSSVEKQLIDLTPKVDRIDTNLLWVMSRIKDGAGQK
jgi:uncharacterized protein HemX